MLVPFTSPVRTDPRSTSSRGSPLLENTLATVCFLDVATIQACSLLFDISTVRVSWRSGHDFAGAVCSTCGSSVRPVWIGYYRISSEEFSGHDMAYVWLLSVRKLEEPFDKSLDILAHARQPGGSFRDITHCGACVR